MTSLAGGEKTPLWFCGVYLAALQVDQGRKLKTDRTGNRPVQVSYIWRAPRHLAPRVIPSQVLHVYEDDTKIADDEAYKYLNQHQTSSQASQRLSMLGMRKWPSWEGMLQRDKHQVAAMKDYEGYSS